jgi:hypothetical protein
MDRSAACDRSGARRIFALGVAALVALALAPAAHADLSLGGLAGEATTVVEPTAAATTAAVEAAGPVAEPVVEAVESVAEPVVAAAEPVAAAVAPAVANAGVESVGNAAGKAVETVVPAVVQPAASAVKNAPAVGEIVETAGAAVAPVTQAVAPALEALGSVLDDLPGGLLPDIPVTLPGVAPLAYGAHNVSVPLVSPPAEAPAPDSPASPAPPELGPGLVANGSGTGPAGSVVATSSGSVVDDGELWPASAGAGNVPTLVIGPGALAVEWGRYGASAPADGMLGASQSTAFGSGAAPPAAAMAALCAALVLALTLLWRRLVPLDRPLRESMFVALLERPG